MFTYNYIKYFGNKTPYKVLHSFGCANIKKNRPGSKIAKLPVRIASIDAEQPKNAPALLSAQTVYEAPEIHEYADTPECREKGAEAVAYASTEESYLDTDNFFRAAQEYGPADAPFSDKADEDDVCVPDAGRDKPAGNSNPKDRLPLALGEGMPGDMSQRISLFSAMDEQRLNDIGDTVSRLADALERYSRFAEAKDHFNAGPCGLLCFREWWDLIEVGICVGGNLISGIPIFIEENTLRVVDKDHSYFIPLGKVDYIRTNDGLCAGLTAVSDNTARK